MTTVLLLGVALTAALVFGTLFLVWAVTKLVFGLILLPLRLVFWVLLLPLWIARTALKAAGFLLVLPLLGITLAVTIVGGLLFVGVPLLLMGGLLMLAWLIARAVLSPVTA
jgi:hypothetical protein